MFKQIKSIAFSTTSLTVTQSTSMPSLSFNVVITYSDNTTVTVSQSGITYTLQYYSNTACTNTASSTWYNSANTYTYVKATITAYNGQSINFVTTNYISVYVQSNVARVTGVYMPSGDFSRFMLTNSNTTTVFSYPITVYKSDGSVSTTNVTTTPDLYASDIYAYSSSYEGIIYDGHAFVKPELTFSNLYNYNGNIYVNSTTALNAISRYGTCYWARYPGGTPSENRESDNVVKVELFYSYEGDRYEWITSNIHP